MYTCFNCSCIPVTWIIITWISLYNRFMHISWIQYMTISCITALIRNSYYLDMQPKDIRCVKLSATWKSPLVFTGDSSRVSHLLFSVITFTDTRIAHVLLSYYMLHALLLFLIQCIINQYNIGLVDTWRLTRSYRVNVWIHYSPTAGDVIVLAIDCYISLSFCFSLLVSP